MSGDKPLSGCPTLGMQALQPRARALQGGALPEQFARGRPDAVQAQIEHARRGVAARGPPNASLRLPASRRRGEELKTISPTRCWIGRCIRRDQVRAVGHELYHDQIGGPSAVIIGQKCRIAAIAAIPIGLAVDLDRLEKLRQCTPTRAAPRWSFLQLEMTRGKPVLTLVTVTNSAGARLAADRVDVDVRRDRIAQRIGCPAGWCCRGDSAPVDISQCAHGVAPPALHRSPLPTRPTSAIAGRAMRSQNERSAARACAGVPCASALATIAALIAPALVPESCAMLMLRVVSSASSTPQV